MSGNNFVLQSYNAGGAGNLLLNPGGGNIGIGTTSPGYALDVYGGLRVDTGGVFFAPTALGASAGTNFLCLDANSWNVRYANGCTASDRRLKDNIVSLTRVGTCGDPDLAAGFLCVEDKHRGKGPQIGLIAQEVEKVFPQIVETGSDGLAGC